MPSPPSEPSAAPIVRRFDGWSAWALIGLAYSGWALRSGLLAEPGQGRAFVFPVVAGLAVAIPAAFRWLRTSAPSTAAADRDPTAVPIPGTWRDTALLVSILLAAWALLPALGLVMVSFLLFIALAVVYRDMSKTGVIISLVVLFVILVFGAERLLEMPLLRSSLVHLPF